ncbi:MAG: hypothetical protein UR43_C0020G0012 [candidate division TM6 bacterium GW2011_GWF2_33_332]|nr:MAG: hypothetical protein UR43_C0020G0012 [candidate division TM6 bacterium GW2011_GWF2_33_332]
MLSASLVLVKTFMPSIIENIVKKYLLNEPGKPILSMEDGPAIIANSLTEEFKNVIEIVSPTFEVPMESIINLIAYEITKFLMGKPINITDSVQYIVSVEISNRVFDMVVEKVLTSDTIVD